MENPDDSLRIVTLLIEQKANVNLPNVSVIFLHSFDDEIATYKSKIENLFYFDENNLKIQEMGTTGNWEK